MPDAAQFEFPRNPHRRRAGILTVVVGGCLLAAMLLALIPTDEMSSGRRLECGAPVAAAFRSPGDYEIAYIESQLKPPPNDLPVDELPANTLGINVVPPIPPQLHELATQCRSDARLHLWIAMALLSAALATLLVIGYTARAHRWREQT